MATRVKNMSTREMIEQGKIINATNNGVKFLEGPTRASVEAANDAFMDVPEVEFKTMSDEEINRLIERWMIPNPKPQNVQVSEFISDIDYIYPPNEHIEIK
jgi:hypothetical protein